MTTSKFSHAINDNNSDDEARVLNDKVSNINSQYKKNDDIVSDQGFWMNPTRNKNNLPLKQQ